MSNQQRITPQCCGGEQSHYIIRTNGLLCIRKMLSIKQNFVIEKENFNCQNLFVCIYITILLLENCLRIIHKTKSVGNQCIGNYLCIFSMWEIYFIE